MRLEWGVVTLFGSELRLPLLRDGRVWFSPDIKEVERAAAGEREVGLHATIYPKEEIERLMIQNEIMGSYD